MPFKEAERGKVMETAEITFQDVGSCAVEVTLSFGMGERQFGSIVHDAAFVSFHAYLGTIKEAGGEVDDERHWPDRTNALVFPLKGGSAALRVHRKEQEPVGEETIAKANITFARLGNHTVVVDLDFGEAGKQANSLSHDSAELSFYGCLDRLKKLSGEIGEKSSCTD